MEKSKFEEAKRIQERIVHFKELKEKIYATIDSIEKNRGIPLIKHEQSEQLANLILSVYESKYSDFVLNDFASMIGKMCSDAIDELEEQFKNL